MNQNIREMIEQLGLTDDLGIEHERADQNRPIKVPPYLKPMENILPEYLTQMRQVFEEVIILNNDRGVIKVGQTKKEGSEIENKPGEKDPNVGPPSL